jgi:predicted RNase H-like HicB family nuclease
MKLQLVLEKSDGDFGASIDAPGIFLTTMADTVEDIEKNMRELIADFLTHEGQDHADWQGVTTNTVEFEHVYDVRAFFEQFDVVKVSAVGKLSGINPGLMRQYASGVKHPSKKQLEKIEIAVHKLGQQLMGVALG